MKIYQIVGKPGQWRFQRDDETSVIYWKFGNDCNRRECVAVPKSEIEQKVVEKVNRRINLSNLEALRGE